jgi:probable rRNA maturation factor
LKIMASARQKPDFVVQIAKNFKNINIRPLMLRKLVKVICNRFKLSKATISIAIVDGAQIRKLNKQFLNQTSPTDCLSFNLSDSNKNSIKSFELVVNGEMAVREANMRGHSSEAELALYITHGLLHNLGFDDSTKKQAEKMHNVEDEILQQLGYGPVYNRA